ncbi:hypothetical protein EB118_25375 [bacterium]|nr:hypothetical protein [Actinomycetota bacterium]NDG33375.1 hypothetical protein [bacterium]
MGVSSPDGEDEFNFQAANVLLRIGGVLLLLFLLFIISRINTNAFPYSPEAMKKFVSSAFQPTHIKS